MTHIPNVRPGAMSGLGGGAPLIPTLTNGGSLEPIVAELDPADVDSLVHPNSDDERVGPDVLAVPIAYTEDDTEGGEPGRSYSEWLPTTIPDDVLDDLLAAVGPEGSVETLVRLRDDGLVEVRVSVVTPDGVYSSDPSSPSEPEPPAPAEPDDTLAASYPFAGSVDDVKAWVVEAKDSDADADRRAFALRTEQARTEPRKTLVAWLD